MRYFMKYFDKLKIKHREKEIKTIWRTRIIFARVIYFKNLVKGRGYHKVTLSREGGDIGLFITLVTKVL